MPREVEDNGRGSLSGVLTKGKIFEGDGTPVNEMQPTYFVYKKLKYIWSESLKRFELLSPWDEQTYSELFPAKPLPEDVVHRRRCLYGPNVIEVHLTPIINLLLNECLNPFYCFQAFSCALWFSDDYYMYASCIVLISAISIITQIYEMRKNQRALKRTVCGSSLVLVCRDMGEFTEFAEVDSTELVPGDILEIPRNGCMMHCDAILLSGNCIVNESTLTGESVPVTKTPLPQQKKDEVFNVRSTARHVLFGGTSVIQTRNYADERVLAMVIRTGFRTAKGELVRSILFPKPLTFKFTQDALKFVGALAVLAFVGFGISVYFMHRSGSSVKSIVLRSLDLITVCVPPALPMAMTVGVVFAQRRLRSKRIYCINPSLINVCGVINVTCFDKTGTLTEDGLDLWGVVPMSNGRFSDPHLEPSEFDRGPLLESMATCHSLTLIEGVLSGDPLDLKMFQSTKWEFIEETEDHCKFEMAVPAIVRPRMQNPSENNSDVDIKCKTGVRSVLSLHTFLIPSDFHSVLLEYTREGYRVLALAWRPLKISYTRMLRIHRERVEQDLLFLGLLVMENRLKPESAPVIRVLRNANIRPVMVTGDNMLTALSVARDCEMIDELDRIVIVSAKPPPTLSTTTDISSDLNAASASGDVNGGNSIPFGCADSGRTNNLPSEMGHWPACDVPAAYTEIFGSHQTVPLVEFHYAEDLHKPVTEVTATSVTTVRNRRRKSSREHRWFRHPNPRSAFTTYYETVAIENSKSNLSPDANGVGEQSSDNLFDSSSPKLKSRSKTATSDTAHRINIRMIDRPDFHLAISGKTWAIIKEHYPWLIPKLVVKGTVFARFSPEQKTQLIESLQSVGYFVAMCGDGANDCGALKAAHAGVSLSEAEASVASPFTSKEQNISCIPTLIREGRCALVTSFGTLKFITGYSLVQSISVISLFYIGSSLSDGQFLYIDLFLITSLSITFGYTEPYPHLSIKPPRMRLLSTITLLSLGCQIAAHLTVQVIAYVLVRAQPWYLPLFDLSDEYELTNYESTVLFTVASYQYLILVVVFSKGAPYRRSMVTNYFFMVNVAVCLVCTLCLTASNFGIRETWLSLVKIPSPMFVLVLHLMVLANFLLCYLVESLVEGVAFRHQLVHIRRALFPRRVHRKDYEQIREEIDRLAGTWPPLIRSASVQALPKELFQDADVVPPVLKTSIRQRKRNISGMSTETEDDEVLPPGNLTETVVFRAPVVGSVVRSQRSPLTARSGRPSDMDVDVVRKSSAASRRRSRSFDSIDLEAWRKHCPSITESKHEEILNHSNDPTELTKFLDMPDSMFHVPGRSHGLPLGEVREKRKRHQSTGPRSEPLCADTGGRTPGHQV
ncbi:Cation-transporting ATPase [Fasciolopsis buskii]|uniref:Cation-transporting ATPase n=1 Tax=Fasciolopsis buskii TaxID=27845 RepID=A0A8E0RWJ9_9TREM|nr:Cation-transporting ATPase [Fasciolopsis buski]